LQEIIPIAENETAGELHDKMKDIGAEVLVKTIKGLVEGSLQERPQDELLKNNIVSVSNHELPHAPKIFTDTCKIDWHRSIEELHNLVRGLSPFPGAFTHLNDKMLKIFKSEKEYHQPTSPPGTMETDGKSFLKFAANDGYLLAKELQMEGKKKMTVVDFLRGYRA
jgi:methionyl-tRNA formyltransferase